MVEKTVEKMF